MNIYDRVLNDTTRHSSFTEVLELLRDEVVEHVEQEIEEGEFEGSIGDHPVVNLLVSELNFKTKSGTGEVARQVCAEFADGDYNQYILGETSRTDYAKLFPNRLQKDE